MVSWYSHHTRFCFISFIEIPSGLQPVSIVLIDQEYYLLDCIVTVYLVILEEVDCTEVPKQLTHMIALITMTTHYSNTHLEFGIAVAMEV